jgi:hypothetical protein
VTAETPADTAKREKAYSEVEALRQWSQDAERWMVSHRRRYFGLFGFISEGLALVSVFISIASAFITALLALCAVVAAVSLLGPPRDPGGLFICLILMVPFSSVFFGGGWLADVLRRGPSSRCATVWREWVASHPMPKCSEFVTADHTRCENCHGDGTTTEYVDNSSADPQYPNGDGKIEMRSVTCKKCDGSGTVSYYIAMGGKRNWKPNFEILTTSFFLK